MTERADFVAAVRALAAEERERAGDHPEPEEIAAYAGGTLAPARAEALRAHLAVCEECTDLLLDYHQFEPEGASTPAPEVAAAYRGLRSSLGLPAERTADALYQTAAPRPVTPWLLAAATLAAVAFGLWGWSQHRALEAMRITPRLNVATVDLQPRGSDQVRAGEDTESSLDLSSGATIYLALPGLSESPDLRVVILDAQEREVWTLPGARPDPLMSNLSLYLPPGSLPPGRYEIRVLPSGAGPALASYPLEIV